MRSSMNVGKRLLQEKRAGARRVLSRPGTLRSDFDCKALERSISIDEAFGRQGNRRNLPGRGRGRCEVAAASKALPPASRPRIGLWLDSPAGASPLSCAIEVRFNSCVLDQGDNSGRELRRGWRAGIFLCFFFLLFFDRGGGKKKVEHLEEILLFALIENSHSVNLPPRPSRFSLSLEPLFLPSEIQSKREKR